MGSFVTAAVGNEHSYRCRLPGVKMSHGNVICKPCGEIGKGVLEISVLSLKIFCKYNYSKRKVYFKNSYLGPSNAEIDTAKKKKNHLISIAVIKVSLLEYKRKTYTNDHQWVTYKEGKEQTSDTLITGVLKKDIRTKE